MISVECIWLTRKFKHCFHLNVEIQWFLIFIFLSSAAKIKYSFLHKKFPSHFAECCICTSKGILEVLSMSIVAQFLLTVQYMNLK